MFYIDTNIHRKQRDFMLIHIVPTIIVFLAFSGITLWSWHAARVAIARERTQILDQKLSSTVSAIDTRLNTYQDILRAGAGLFGASDTVTRAEWKQFVNVFDLDNRYPGIHGVGFVEVIQPDKLETHTAAIRSEGYPGYSVHPAGSRDIYTSIIYIEPFSGNNLKAFGYDMYSEPSRKAAMDRARDSGQPAVTSKVVLVQEDRNNAQPGFLMYVPVYKRDSNPQTIPERQSNLVGYVYAPFRTHDLLDEVLRENDANYVVRIYDHTFGKDTLIYQSDDYKTVSRNTAMHTAAISFSRDSSNWTIESGIRPEAISAQLRSRPATIVWGGLLLSTCIAGFVYLLLLNRTGRLARREAKALQKAKDELLALASHQLRTPATGVKQYIGMLREGYAGKLSKEQNKLLDKANQSNERQLGTINDILVIARADAGNLELYFARTDIRKMLEDILDEQEEVIRTHKQTLVRSLPKRPVYVVGDAQYLRMAIENIVSNATKYTHGKGILRATLTKAGPQVYIVVKDTGVGVAKQDFTLLFRKFSRIPNDLTSKVNGSGIGLYLAKKIIDAHGGTIDFVSTLGQGSTVTIGLPAGKQPTHTEHIV